MIEYVGQKGRKKGRKEGRYLKLLFEQKIIHQELLNSSLCCTHTWYNEQKEDMEQEYSEEPETAPSEISGF